MLRDNSDKAWELWGSVEPYWAVCSKADFLLDKIDDTSLLKFFQSGEDHVEWLFQTITDHVDRDFTPRVALDFGCGLGRVSIPLAKKCERVLGVDVSDTMLGQARKNVEAHGLKNLKFVKADDTLSNIPPGYDLLHSYIVFQHIPPRRGLRFTRKLVEGLKQGGVGVLHYVILNRAPIGVRLCKWMCTNLPLARGGLNLVRRRPWAFPIIQMNTYPLLGLFQILHDTGCRRVLGEFTDHEGYVGVVLIFVKDVIDAMGAYKP